MKISPSNVVIEITETRANDDVLRSMVERFKALNFEIAIDDFGVLYSNRLRIQQLQPDFVKLDGKWLSNLFNQTNFSNTLRKLHQELEPQGIQIIYEGIESTEVLELAVKCGAQFLQGSLTGSPQLAEAKSKS